MYFSSTNAQGETTSEGATIVARFNSKMKLLSRPDGTSNVSYSNYRNVNETNTTVVTNNDEYHYIFSIHYDSSSSSLQIHINGDKKGENNADLEGALTNTIRGANLIGTNKEQLNATYLKGVVKYLKIYQNAMTSSEVTSTLIIIIQHRIIVILRPEQIQRNIPEDILHLIHILLIILVLLLFL